MGDFNATLQASYSEGGDRSWNGHRLSFAQCLQQAELIPVPYRGLKYSWHNGQGEDRVIMKKLDWVIGNITLLKKWPGAITHFLTRNVSDHSSMVLQLSRDHYKPQPRFLFLNFWTEREDFVPHIAQIWQKHAHGSPIFKLSTKLQWVKNSLMNWHRHNRSHISSRVNKARQHWGEAQERLDANPSSEMARTNERHAAKTYQKLCQDEESFYRQKSRIQWLTLGDKNTSFFHKSLLHRRSRNKITSLQDGVGNVLHDKQELGRHAADYYKKLISSRDSNDRNHVGGSFNNQISDSRKQDISRPISREEIKSALFSISDNKAPGLDGFTAIFFKKCWSIVGNDFVAAIQYFLKLASCQSGSMQRPYP